MGRCALVNREELNNTDSDLMVISWPQTNMSRSLAPLGARWLLFVATIFFGFPLIAAPVPTFKSQP